MSHSFGSAVLSTFDIREEEREFLSQLIESPDTPCDETRRLVDSSILANSEDFHYLIDCATSIQQANRLPHDNLGGNDILTFVWHILAGEGIDHNADLNPWAETDRLILLAKELATDPDIQGPFSCNISNDIRPPKRSRLRSRSTKYTTTVSHFWSTEPSTQAEPPNGSSSHGYSHLQKTNLANGLSEAGVTNIKQNREVIHQRRVAQSTKTIRPQCRLAPSKTGTLCPTARISPYFATGAVVKKSPKRPPAGVVSSVRFPPLSSPTFGLVQERLAHEPFWLLIAVTFLIKTSGQAAIPVFYKVKERFPSPEELKDPDNSEEILSMVRHLGLAIHRLAFIHKFAEAYSSNPPTAEKLYRVRNYDKRDTQHLGVNTRSNGESIRTAVPSNDDEAHPEAWEIGHMTKGKYTLDSWRIFCRDEFLGRAQDWNGKGQKPEFQPEWMRVRPLDKELRAYLRWMWMREGWEWDPETGERRALRPELQAAVNEGRVEYDNSGGLRILNTPAQDMDDRK